MQLISATDYAVRSILYLVAVDRMATAAEISEKMKVPKQYFITLSRKLREAGILTAEAGVKGGYRLVRPPEEITLLDIMRITESSTMINQCLEKNGSCNCCSPADCPVSHIYMEFQSIMEDFFGGVTFADIIKKMHQCKKKTGTAFIEQITGEQKTRFLNHFYREAKEG